MNNRLILFILTLIAILLVGCASARAPEMHLDQSFDAGGAPMEDTDVEMEEMARSDSPARNFGGEAAPLEPLVIRNASLRLVVEDPSQSADEIASLAEFMGGFVVNSNLYQTTYGSSDVPTTRASITIRVPAERLDEALDEIVKEATEVQERSVSGQDVTREYTDLQSRLRNLEAAEEQLLEIMDAATETDDVVKVFDNLRYVREDIEVLKGQINYYEDAARLSAISIDLIPDELAKPISIGGWHPEGTVKDAVEGLINALQFLADVGIRFVISVVPILLIFGIPGYFVGRTIIRRRREKQVQSSEEENSIDED